VFNFARKYRILLTDGGAEEISNKLKDANRYQMECKHWMSSFWGNLMREEDIHGLTDLVDLIRDIIYFLQVAMIETYERKAEHIYTKLLTKFPKSARVLRAYGLFFEEIKNDVESAQVIHVVALAN